MSKTLKHYANPTEKYKELPENIKKWQTEILNF